MGSKAEWPEEFDVYTYDFEGRTVELAWEGIDAIECVRRLCPWDMAELGLMVRPEVPTRREVANH